MKSNNTKNDKEPNSNCTKANIYKEIKNFFIYNKGKAFSIFTALGLIAALLFPLIDIEKSSSIPNEFHDSIIQIINGDNNTMIQYKKTDSQIEIVDITIEESNEFPMLDIKLRNSGDTVAYLYKIEVVMDDFFQMYNIYKNGYMMMEPSHNYDMMLTEKDVQSLDISQVIPGNDADRFTITLATNTGDEPEVPAICTFSIKLYYNDNQYIESKTMTIPINDPQRYSSIYTYSTDDNLAYQNYKNLCRINEYISIKSTYFNKIFESYEENKKDFIPTEYEDKHQD